MDVTFKCHPKLEPFLPKPVASKLMLPDWLKGMPMLADDPVLEESMQTVKQCPPVFDAMTSGFMVLLPCDVHFSKGKFKWDWPEFPVDDYDVRTMPGSSPITHHHPTQVVGSPFFTEGRLLIKFLNFWTIQVPDGHSLLFTHPFNRADLPFVTLTGLVDSDRYYQHFVHFPAAWVDDEFDGILEKGTPVAQVIPIKRDALQMNLAFDVMNEDEFHLVSDTFADLREQNKHYRRTFRTKK